MPKTKSYPYRTTAGPVTARAADNAQIHGTDNVKPRSEAKLHA